MAPIRPKHVLLGLMICKAGRAAYSHRNQAGKQEGRTTDMHMPRAYARGDQPHCMQTIPAHHIPAKMT